VIDPPVARVAARVELGAVQRNCVRLVSELGEGVALCAVVKANGYGHGAAECAEAALAGGASWLAVAAATEAWELRDRFPQTPILTMGALTPAELDVALQARSDVALWSEGFRAAVAARGEALGLRPRMHVKYDTGMGRLGERDPEAVTALVRACAEDERLERFRAVAEPLRDEHPELIVHAANSAATLRRSASHFDMVRCGIAIYGLDPMNEDPTPRGLEPALELSSYVAEVKRLDPGDTVGYGRRWSASRETLVGVLPVGYGDGVRRGLTNEGEVLIGGRRYPFVGTVSMDNLAVELGPDSDVEPGAPAVLIGAQGGERILAEEMARSLETINYEVTCGISSRVPRTHRS
jgi:alanine racemase